MIKRRRFPRIFPGWWIVIGGGILSLWGHAYYTAGIGPLFKPVASELGLSRAATSVPASIGRLEGGFEAPLSGWLTDRYGPKWIVLLGVFLIGSGLILMSLVNSLWTFYVAWGVILGSGINIGLALPLDTSITNWFVKKRGLAIGIKWAFSGGGNSPLYCLANSYPGLADGGSYWRHSYAGSRLAPCLVLPETAPAGVLRLTP